MKKAICILLCLTLTAGCLGLGACATGGPKAAFLLYDAQDTFISEMMVALEQNMPEGLFYEVRDAAKSQSRQNQQILELIEQGFGLLIINAVDRLACSSIVEKCTAAGVDVIFFNREPLEDAMVSEGKVFYVGADADSHGKRQAEMSAALFGEFVGGAYDNNKDGIIQLVILKGEQGHQDAEKRTDNCVNRLRELDYEVEVLAIEPANWMRQEAYEVMRRLYENYGKSIELIFANNDDMALGAIDYLLDTGVFDINQGPLSQPFIIIGVDGTRVGLEAIRQGQLYGTVLNDSARQTQAILTLMDYLLEDKDMGDFPYEITNGHYIFIDGEGITRKNLDSFLP